eukprot:scaffold3583_cov33-Phaeocystis_antarctica.AAC.2
MNERGGERKPAAWATLGRHQSCSALFGGKGAPTSRAQRPAPEQPGGRKASCDLLLPSYHPSCEPPATFHKVPVPHGHGAQRG